VFSPDGHDMGRPTKLTDELQERICLAMRNGDFLKTAAALVGISEATLHVWLRDKRPRYQAFTQGVRQAEAEHETRGVSQLSRSGEQHPMALLKMLERRHRANWGEHANPLTVDGFLEQIALEENSQAPINPSIPPEYLRAFATVLLAIRRGESPEALETRFARLDGLRSTDEDDQLDMPDEPQDDGP
jgi:hypothetical protein